MSYAEALTLLGRDDSRLAGLLDHVSSGMVFAAAALRGGAGLGLADARDDLVGYGHELCGDLAARRRDRPGRDRSELLIAAHSVVVLTAYLEALAACAVGHGDRITDGELREVMEALAEARIERGRAGIVVQPDVDSIGHRPIPCPSAARPFEQVAGDVRDLYLEFSPQVERVLECQELRTRIAEEERSAVPGRLRRVADVAVGGYRSLYHRLAADCPEFFFWANLGDGAATRSAARETRGGLWERLDRLVAEVGEARIGMAALPRLLELAGLAGTQHAAAGLGRRAASVLDGPLNDATIAASPLLQSPSVQQGYVNPSVRVASSETGRRIADARWWDGEPVIGDLQRVIVAALLGPDAAEAPTFILGEPGSGKSLLTKVLAASLATAGLVAVRVELRRVDPSAPIQAQIEDAIAAATGERASWPELVRASSAEGRVVLFDGFDELLLAAEASHSDYLERIREFQVRELDLGRPVSVVVTSRTVVADRVRLPPESLVVRLEPFSDAQIELWLRRWAETNRSYFAATGTAALTVASLPGSFQEFARQPLLLLMLALCDADGNLLARASRNVPLGTFYGLLLGWFVERELRTLRPGLVGVEFAEALERQLTLLSHVAFAIFVRGRQSIAEGELAHDLERRGLVSGPARSYTRRITSRFFFIHDSTVRVNGVTHSAYEFMHASFGEYLVARYCVRLLGDGEPADRMLAELLSLRLLASRGSVLGFIRDELAQLDRDRRAALGARALALMHATEPSASRYVDRPAWAIRGANLLILALAADGGAVELPDLFQRAPDPVDRWRRITHLWRATLSAAQWRLLVRTLIVERGDDGTQVRARIRLFPAAADGAGSAVVWLSADVVHREFTRGDLGYPDEVRDAAEDLWLQCTTLLGDLFVLLGLTPR
ncbi:NACHT domain-containing protein [Dactylosporangium salmoneum]|uniref:AAA+ ATPase domain-containing protein n=1 Tax=Dactylosporangium salmoneum TaxID=53361 RepID=A0ABN3FC50_9ACTN